MRVSGRQQMVALTSIAKRRDSEQLPKLQYKIGVSSEHTYTKDDAIRNQYNKQFDLTEFHITLDDLRSGNFDTSGIRLPSFNQEDMDSYTKKLQKDGLGEDIDWDGVKIDFNTVDVDIDSVDIVNTKIDYVASRFAVLKDRIERDYSGDELNLQLELLNNLCSNAKQKIADSYAKTVGGFLEENGTSGETDKLYESVMLGIDDRAIQYSTFIKQNVDYAGTIEKSNQWLLYDDGYMAARLRDNMIEPKKEVIAKPSALSSEQTPAYSLHDLEIAGTYVKQMAYQYDSLEHVGVIQNEESLGLDLSVQAMKIDFLTKNSGTSDNMASLINNSFDGYMEKYLNRVDEKLKEQSKNWAHLANGQEEYAPLNKKAVFDVFEYTMNCYKDSNDIIKALVDGAKYGKEKFDSKVDSKECGPMARYQGDKLSVWDDFFTKPNPAPYVAILNNFQRYEITINYFMQSLNSGKISDINLMLSKNGDISADLITYSNQDKYTQRPFENVYA